MGAITGTKTYAGEFAGEIKLLVLTATIASASDTITLTAASHGGVVEIVGVAGIALTGGVDADFMQVMPTFSGLVVTLTSKQGDGAAADEFTGTTIALSLLVRTTAS